MKVQALKECFHLGRRRKGDVFEYDLAEGATLPSWLKAVSDTTPEGRAVPEPQPRETPVALSEMAKPVKTDDPKTLSDVEQPDPDLEHAFLR